MMRVCSVAKGRPKPETPDFLQNRLKAKLPAMVYTPKWLPELSATSPWFLPDLTLSGMRDSDEGLLCRQ